MDKSKLAPQLQATIEALEGKFAKSSEKAVAEYLVKYRNAVKDSDDLQTLNKILGCSRGYLETSSNYDQFFLNEMSKTEALIKLIHGL